MQYELTDVRPSPDGKSRFFVVHLYSVTKNNKNGNILDDNENAEERAYEYIGKRITIGHYDYPNSFGWLKQNGYTEQHLMKDKKLRRKLYTMMLREGEPRRRATIRDVFKKEENGEKHFYGLAETSNPNFIKALDEGRIPRYTSNEYIDYSEVIKDKGHLIEDFLPLSVDLVNYPAHDVNIARVNLSQMCDGDFGSCSTSLMPLKQNSYSGDLTEQIISQSCGCINNELLSLKLPSALNKAMQDILKQNGIELNAFYEDKDLVIPGFEDLAALPVQTNDNSQIPAVPITDNGQNNQNQIQPPVLSDPNRPSGEQLLQSEAGNQLNGQTPASNISSVTAELKPQELDYNKIVQALTEEQLLNNPFYKKLFDDATKYRKEVSVSRRDMLERYFKGRIDGEENLKAKVDFYDQLGDKRGLTNSELRGVMNDIFGAATQVEAPSDGKPHVVKQNSYDDGSIAELLNADKVAIIKNTNKNQAVDLSGFA